MDIAAHLYLLASNMCDKDWLKIKTSYKKQLN